MPGSEIGCKVDAAIHAPWSCCNQGLAVGTEQSKCLQYAQVSSILTLFSPHHSERNSEVVNKFTFFFPLFFPLLSPASRYFLVNSD